MKERAKFIRDNKKIRLIKRYKGEDIVENHNRQLLEGTRHSEEELLSIAYQH